MARRKLTLQDRIKGARALLRSTKKVPEHFRKAARALLQKHGYAVALAFVALLAVAPAHAQREQVRYAAQFYNGGANPTVGAMYTAAQNSCIADTAVPCIIVADSTLAVYPAGVIPTPCAQCLFIDYRQIGVPRFATNAAPTLTNAFGTSFPLTQAASSVCATPNPQFSSDADATSGIQIGNQRVTVCILGVPKHIFTSTNDRVGNAVLFCWSSNVNADGAVCDLGLSRGASNQVNCGNGTAADRSCALFAGTGNFSGALTVASCAGCGGGSSIISSMMTGSCSPALTNTLVPLAFGGSGGASCVTSTAITEIAIRAGTVQNLRVVAGTAGVNASSGAFTVFKNAVAQTLTCTVGTGTSCNDTTHPFTTVAGDKISVRGSTQAAETLANVSITVEVN